LEEYTEMTKLYEYKDIINPPAKPKEAEKKPIEKEKPIVKAVTPFCPLQQDEDCSQFCAWYEKVSGTCVMAVIAKTLYRWSNI